MERAELARRLGAVAMAAGAARRPAATVIGEAQPARFMPAFARAVAGSGPVFVTDPARAGGPCVALDEHVREGGGEAERGWLMIPSGGTGGGVKFARHAGETLAAAVGGFCAHFGLARVNAVGVLPLHHVSGLMAWMRCALTGGVFLPWNWGDLKEGRRPELATREPWVLSLVPTQLQRLLERPEAVAWLRRFEIVFVGGGPVWPELVEAAARADLPLALSYGMTETAAMVTALRPGEFRAGGRSSGTALPHARVTVTADGVVEVAGAAVCRGYYPEWSGVGAFRTEDLGVLDAEGRLTVLGRRDAIINTGGEKVRPEEVTVSLPDVSPESVGALIALYDRAVGFYGSLVNINAYHQPGVEAGKKAATAVIDLQHMVAGALGAEQHTAAEVAAALGADAEQVYHVLRHLAASRPSVHCSFGDGPGTDRFSRQ